MADVQKQFQEFHETIKLNNTDENQTLREKRDAVLDKLRAGLKKQADQGQSKLTFDTRNQGSYAMGTGIKPVAGDYDIDVALFFNESKEDWTDPVSLKRRVRDALLGDREAAPDIRLPCVTVSYAKKGEAPCHVDLAVISAADKNEDGENHLSFGKEHSEAKQRYWEKTDPVGLVTTIGDKHKNAPEDGAQFRRSIRYLKRWRQEKFNDSGKAGPVGIGFTVAAYHGFTPRSGIPDPMNGKRAYDDLAALVDFVDRMLSDFRGVWHDEEWADRLSAMLPVEPKNDVFERMSNAQMTAFKEKLTSLRDTLRAAQEEEDPTVACKMLRRQFGDDFPIPDPKSTAKKKAAAIVTSSAAA